MDLFLHLVRSLSSLFEVSRSLQLYRLFFHTVYIFFFRCYSRHVLIWIESKAFRILPCGIFGIQERPAKFRGKFRVVALRLVKLLPCRIYLRPSNETVPYTGASRGYLVGLPYSQVQSLTWCLFRCRSDRLFASIDGIAK